MTKNAMDIIKWSGVFKSLLEVGVPLEAGDRILDEVMAVCGPTCLAPKLAAVKKVLNDYACTPRNYQRIFICSRCHRGIPFLNVFCPYCLEEEKLVWLIKGCNNKKCDANPRNFCNGFNKDAIQNYKDSVCTHCRRTAAYREVYYNSMISIVGNMVKTGLLNRLSNTTYEEMVATATICKEEKVMSNILSSNSLSVLKWLDVPVFRYLESCAEVVYADHGNDTSCLDKGLANCAGQQSIERELYSFDEVDQLDKNTLKVLKQRFNDHANDKFAESTNRVGEITLRPVSGDAPAGDAPVGDAPVGDAPAGDAPASDVPAGNAPLPPEGNPGSEPSTIIPGRKRRRTEATPAPSRKSSRERKPNTNRGIDPSMYSPSNACKEKGHPNKPANTNPKSSVKPMSYSKEDVNLLLNYKKSKKRVWNPDEKEEKTPEELRCEELLKRLNCSNGETLVAAMVIALWLEWKAISEELQSVGLYKDLLREYLSKLPKEQQAKAACIASTCRSKGGDIITSTGFSHSY